MLIRGCLFSFFSHTMRAKHNDPFNHEIYDVREGRGYNDFLFFENISMNDSRIYDLPQPTGPQQPATKKYVDDNLTSFIKLDGSRAMTGNLKMDKKYIEDLETSNDVPITDLVNYRKDAYRAANKEYLRQNFLKKDENGGDYYDLKQKVIRNAEPYRDGLSNDNDLVSKAFVDAEIAKLPKNYFKIRWLSP